MILDRKRPVRSFIKKASGVAGLATIGLAWWTLTTDDGRNTYCPDPEVQGIYGLCLPGFEFAGVVLLWFGLLWVGLSFPAVLMAAARWFMKGPPARPDA